MEVLERDNGRVKIHYVGYSDVNDEWRDEKEIAPFGVQGALQMEPYRPYCHHRELARAIKAALRSALPRRDPDVWIEIPFDQLVYNGGLKKVGTFVRTFRGNDVHQIKMYDDLVPLLGIWWCICVLNEQKDFCAAKFETVMFHLGRRPDLTDFSPEDRTLTPCKEAIYSSL